MLLRWLCIKASRPYAVFSLWSLLKSWTELKFSSFLSVIYIAAIAVSFLGQRHYKWTSTLTIWETQKGAQTCGKKLCSALYQQLPAVTLGLVSDPLINNLPVETKFQQSNLLWKWIPVNAQQTPKCWFFFSPSTLSWLSVSPSAWLSIGTSCHVRPPVSWVTNVSPASAGHRAPAHSQPEHSGAIGMNCGRRFRSVISLNFCKMYFSCVYPPIIFSSHRGKNLENLP